jgi:uncharacterized protein (TIGR03435 family)
MVPGGVQKRIQGNRITYTSVRLHDILEFAFSVDRYKVIGPEWLDTEFYDILATLPDAAQQAQIPMMFQQMLFDRFKLAAHREEKELPFYALVVSKGGPKLQKQDQALPIRFFNDRGALRLTGRMAVRILAANLSFRVDRPVVDMTGIGGLFDVDLRWTTQSGDPTLEDTGDLFAAIQQFLGLRLEPRKGPIDVLVIDSIQKGPTEK